MRRLVVGGIAGIAAVFLGSLLVLDRLTREPEGPRAVQERYVPPPPPPPDLTLPGNWKKGDPPLPPPPGPTAADFERMVERGPARVEPPRGSWEAVPVASARGRGDKVMAGVQRELNDLHESLSTCFDPGVAARYGTAGISEVKVEEAEEDLGATVFVLQLEMGANAARVVDAPVQTRGGVPDETIACAQSMLRGRTLQVPGARAGERRRLQYKLMP